LKILVNANTKLTDFAHTGEFFFDNYCTFLWMIEVPLSKTPNPQSLPRRQSKNGCPLLKVCVFAICVCVFTTPYVCVLMGTTHIHTQTILSVLLLLFHSDELYTQISAYDQSVPIINTKPVPRKQAEKNIKSHIWW